jgi:uncharacterized protein
MNALTNAMKMVAERALLVRAGGLNDQGAVPSPCVSVCKMDAERGVCMGCLRTLSELGSWSRLDNPAKRAVWQLIESRLP